MPRKIVPHKSSLHCPSCLSLYRALLRESARASRATDDEVSCEPLRSLISTRFHKDKKLLSYSQTAASLSVGYGYLKLLQDCSAGSSAAHERVKKTLAEVTSQRNALHTYRKEIASKWKPPPAEKILHLRNLRAIASPQNHEPASSEKRIFQHPRPLSEIKSSVRKVPNLILAQGIPLLKYPGPTPVLLNRILKEKINWNLLKWQQHKDLEYKIEIGEAEDQWDRLLARHEGIISDEPDTAEEDLALDENESGPRIRRVQTQGLVSSDSAARGVQSASSSDNSWTKDMREVDQGVYVAVLKRGKNYAELGAKYWKEVIFRERELKEKERREAKHARRMARTGLPIGGGWSGPAAEEGVSSLDSGYL
jgi:hypothetical protein